MTTFPDAVSRMLAALGQGLRRATASTPGSWLDGRFPDGHDAFLTAPWPGQARDYRLYLPRGYAAGSRLPLVVMLHGCDQDAASFAAGTGVDRLADEEGFLVLCPEQNSAINPGRCWNWFDAASQRGEGDTAVLAGLVRQVRTAYGADPRRVYVAGLSAGGAMAAILASCHPGLFAAAAAHSGLPYGAARSPWDAVAAMRSGPSTDPRESARHAWKQGGHLREPMPFMVIHGSADPVVHPVNADKLVEQFLWLNHFALGDGAGALPVPRTSSHAGDGDARGYRLREYRLDGTVVLQACIVEGMEHAWSGGDAEWDFGDPGGPDASRLIWEFFRRCSRRTPAP